MILLIFFLVIVFFLGLIFLVYKQEESKRIGIIISFLIAMFVTLMGVYLAFEISDYQNQIEGKESLEANINRAISELDTEKNNIEILASLSNDTNVSIIDENPIRELQTLNLLLADTDLPRYGSSECTGTILSSIITLEKIRKNLNDNNSPPNRRYSELEMYFYEIKYINIILDLELMYLKGDLNEKKLKEIRQDLITHKIFRTL